MLDFTRANITICLGSVENPFHFSSICCREGVLSWSKGINGPALQNTHQALQQVECDTFPNVPSFPKAWPQMTHLGCHTWPNLPLKGFRWAFSSPRALDSLRKWRSREILGQDFQGQKCSIFKLQRNKKGETFSELFWLRFQGLPKWIPFLEYSALPMVLSHTPLLFYVNLSAGFKATKTASLPDSRPLSILISESISERQS